MLEIFVRESQRERGAKEEHQKKQWEKKGCSLTPVPCLKRGVDRVGTGSIAWRG